MTKLSTRSLVRVGITTLALTLAACGGGGGSDGTDAPAPATAALSQAASCDDLLESIRADAREKIRVQANELRERGWSYMGGGVPSPQATATPGAQPTPAAGSGPPRDATDTNTQVPGVDEADVVEIDDGRLYLLRHGELLVLPTTPPESMTVSERITIEGGALGMFVADGRALVVSSVVDPGDLGGDRRCDAIGLPFPGDFTPPCGAIFTKMTLLDLTAMPARIVREVYVEGGYVGARRHGTRARLIVQRSWGAPPGVGDPWEALWFPAPADTEDEFVRRVTAWERAAIAAIDASAKDQWLPTVRERVAGTLVERPLDCTDTWVAPPAHAQHGTTLIVGLDLGADDAPLDDTTLVGLGTQLYANEDTLVLAYPDWQAAPLGESTTRTALHVFAVAADGDAAYRGSGFVPGDVLSQFSMDVHEDVIRVATRYNRALDFLSVTRVHTARIEQGALTILGATGDIAPGEQLQSARFLGNRAYLVTFLQIDPLFVIDLADPTAPTILGEVEIPGFSQYLHPLDANHLLTIGQSADRGPALKIFDVSDASAPRLLHGYDLPSSVSSPAQWNHLAFTYDARLRLLALPVTAYALPPPPAELQLLDIDPANGITLHGTVRHGTPMPEPCPAPYDSHFCATTEFMERGVFVGDVVYSISDREVRAQRIDAPATPLATVQLD